MSFPFRDKASFKDRFRGKSSEEIINELRHSFDEDRKKFFDTSKRWTDGGGPTTFSRTKGFPFNNERMRTGNFKDHLDDLAQRHPEFADQLKSWGDIDLQRAKKEDDAAQKRSVEEEESEEPGPLRGKLRNTVPDMQRREQEEEASERAQRARSAPPCESGVPPKKPLSAKVEMNSSDHTPRDSPQPQPAPGQPKQPVVRHIPIFVEGRDEPVLPKDAVDSPFSQRRMPETHFRTESPSRRAASPRPADHAQPQPSHPHPQFHQNQQVNQPQQPQQHPPQPQQHPHPPQTTPHPHHQPSHPQTQHHAFGERAIPIHFEKTQGQAPDSHPHVPPTQQQAPQPSPQAQPKPKPPQQPLDPIQKVHLVQKEVEELNKQVDAFSGSKSDKDFVYLDEMLTRNLLKLDNIESEGREDVRAARKETIRNIQRCISILESKALVDGSAANTENGSKSDVNKTNPNNSDTKSSVGAPGQAETNEHMNTAVN